MKQAVLVVFFLLFSFKLKAQDTIKLTRIEAENIFLQNNLLLISEKLNIESQKAEVLQAKLWPNPEFSIGEINLWKNSTVQPSPPFFGNFGRDQQVAFEINQLVQMAGKRKKLIALEKVDVAKSEQYFENLLRGLKLELRNLLTELQYIQQTFKIYQKLNENFSILLNAYNNQLEKGNFSKVEFTKLKAQELEITKEILELTHKSIEIQKELKLLLRIHPFSVIVITEEGFEKDTRPYQSIFINQTIDSAKQNRPDYKIALLNEDYSSKLLSYQKAQRFPDLKFGINYDRNGNTMLDFVGVGVAMDLPIFNRNQGKIKQAQINIDNARIQKEQITLTIENEIVLSYQSLQLAIDFLNKIKEGYDTDWDLLLENYTQNFNARNVNMLEYFDFIRIYLNSKKNILEAQKLVNQKAEEFNYSLGKDF